MLAVLDDEFVIDKQHTKQAASMSLSRLFLVNRAGLHANFHLEVLHVLPKVQVVEGEGAASTFSHNFTPISLFVPVSSLVSD